MSRQRRYNVYYRENGERTIAARSSWKHKGPSQRSIYMSEATDKILPLVELAEKHGLTRGQRNDLENCLRKHQGNLSKALKSRICSLLNKASASFHYTDLR